MVTVSQVWRRVIEPHLCSDHQIDRELDGTTSLNTGSASPHTFILIFGHYCYSCWWLDWLTSWFADPFWHDKPLQVNVSCRYRPSCDPRLLLVAVLSAELFKAGTTSLTCHYVLSGVSWLKVAKEKCLVCWLLFSTLEFVMPYARVLLISPAIFLMFCLCSLSFLFFFPFLFFLKLLQALV